MSASSSILLVNGPNLNTLGQREPAIYGTTTLAEVVAMVEHAAEPHGLRVHAVQSNHEGELIDAIQAARGRHAGIIINPGGFSHTSIALVDALQFAALPVIEVHVSNIHAREEFRHRSLISPVAHGVIIGLGPTGYALAVTALAGILAANPTS